MENQEKKIDKKGLMEKYSDYILSKGERPVNVYVFTKDIGLSESDFYTYFSGFEAIEKEYLVYFFQQSVELTQKTDNYQDLSAKEKLLNFYYIFFENLNMNRSLVLMILDTDLRSGFNKLRHLKKYHREIVQSLSLARWDLFEKLPEKLKVCKEKPKEEVLWLHFLSVLEFWKKDQSPGFEKTDLFIEKSIDTGLDVVDSPLIDKFIDFGKFFWNEKFR